MDSAFWLTLDAGAAALGLDLTPGLRAAVDAHVRLLMAWNEQINLTALRTPEQMARGHVLDSLAALPELRTLTCGAPMLLDLGSGGGFPGLPLAVALPCGRAALVDSVAKKARFLAVAGRAVSAAVSAAGNAAPEISALAERAEDLADDPDHRESWDLVLARAVGGVAELAEIGLPLVKVGGQLVIWKSNSGNGGLQREIDAAARVAQAAGGARGRIVELPAVESVGLAGHCLVVLRKRRVTPLRYPRPAGERRRSPSLS